MPNITKSNFITAAHKGILAGINDYIEWYGEFPKTVPEYVFITSVARTLKSTYPSSSLVLEYSPENVLYDANARGRGRLSGFMRPNGRIDIVLYDGNGNPKTPIEIKKIHRDNLISFFSLLENDINRIDELVSKNSDMSSILFGALVFYLSFHGDGELTKYLERLSRSFEERLNEWMHQYALCNFKLDYSPINEFESVAWRSGVIVVEKT